jgi:hypothetical protein
MFFLVSTRRHRAAQQQQEGKEWSDASVSKMIAENKIAPIVSPDEDAKNEECPICFLVSAIDRSIVWRRPFVCVTACLTLKVPLNTTPLGLCVYQHSGMLQAADMYR